MREDRGIGTLRGAPPAMRLLFAVALAAAVVLPLVLRDVGAPSPRRPEVLAAAVLVGVSVINVEMARWLAGGVSLTQQPHKALSAWAFACGLLLPPPWLLVVVPLTYAHTWWRGLRVVGWKWTGSAAYLVLAGLAGGIAAHAVLGTRPDPANWMDGNGGLGLTAILVGGATFLLVETVLFHGSARLNHPEDEQWLRATLGSRWFYLTEAAMLMIGGLLSAVWTGGGWFALLFVPIYMLAQRASMHDLVSERNEALEQTNRFKVDLLGMLGHEIGNPLTSVMGHAQVGVESLEDGDTAQAARSLTVVERNAQQIRYVLTDVLTLVASESGELVATPEVCPVQPAVLAAVAALPEAGRPRVEGAADATAMVQPHHLDQMLANLLGNAVKYAGGADVVRVEAVGPAVRITVADHGPGVPEGLRERLFERFSRADDTRQRPGTGLGLFITRELARAYGGDVVHHAAEPHGAVFELTLPAAGAP